MSNATIHCCHCGKAEELRWMDHVNQRLRDLQECFSCNHFLSLHRDPVQTSFFRINGVHYSAEPGIKSGGMRGFGGRKFTIETLDGRRKFTTNDVWCQGTIPEHLRSIMPDNARFVD